jgi:hypothetical protein
MTSTWHRTTLPIDQQLALRTAVTNLGREFDGTFGVETIERFLHSSYDEFAGRAVILNFLPLLAERFARWLGTGQHHQSRRGRRDGRARHRHRWRVPQAVDRRDRPRRRRRDLHGLRRRVPGVPRRRYEEWVLDDPAGLSVADVRPIRDEIERRVRALLTELTTAAPA